MFTTKNKRVLIIEDDENQAELIKALLMESKDSVLVDWAATSAQAFHYLKKNNKGENLSPYDLIIADIFLEGAVTGCDIWRLCRAVFPEVPVLLTSSIEKKEIAQMFLSEAKKPFYLQKPLDINSARNALMKSMQASDAALVEELF